MSRLPSELFYEMRILPDYKDPIVLFAISQKLFAFSTNSGEVIVQNYINDEKYSFNPFKKPLKSLSMNSTGLIICSLDDGKMCVYSKNEKILEKSTKLKSPVCVIDPQSTGLQDISFVFHDDERVVKKFIPKKTNFNFLEFEKISNQCDEIYSLTWINDTIIWMTKTQIFLRIGKENKVIPFDVSNFHTNDFSKSQILFDAVEKEYVAFRKGLIFRFNQTGISTHNVEEKSDCLAMAFGTHSKASFELIQGSPFNLHLQYRTLNADIPLIDLINFEPKLIFFDISAFRNTFAFVVSKKIRIITFVKDDIFFKLYLQQDIEAAQDYFEQNIDSFDPKYYSAIIYFIVQKFLEVGELDKAIGLCFRFQEQSDWTQLIELFSEKQQLKILFQAIPFHTPFLTVDQTTNHLIKYIENCPEQFCLKFYGFNSDEYSVSRLLEPVSYLSLENKQFIPAHVILLIENKEVSSAVEVLQNNFNSILACNDREFLRYVANHYTELSEDFILELISRAEQNSGLLLRDIELFKMNYLKVLHEIPAKQVRDLWTPLAYLMLKHGDPSALSFLKQSPKVDLVYLRDFAYKFENYAACAYIWQKLGGKDQGMKILLDSKCEPKDLVQYAKECDEKSIWEDLKTNSYSNPQLLVYVLQNLPNIHLNPVKFVSGIPSSSIKDVPNFDELVEVVIEQFERKAKTSEIVQSIIAQDQFGAYNSAQERFKRAVVINFE